MSFRASASSWIIFLNAQIMPNLLNTSSLRVGDADHGLRALLYPNLQGKNFLNCRGWGRWGSYGPLSAADTAAPPSSAASFFFRDRAFFGDSERSGFGYTDGRRRRRNRAPPLKPQRFFEQKIAKFLSPIFFFKKKFGAKIFLAILKMAFQGHTRIFLQACPRASTRAPHL